VRLQETVTVGDRVEGILSHIVALEARFATLPGNVAEQRLREELKRYAIIPPFRLGAEILPASSNASKDSCGIWLRSLSRGDTLTMLKTTKSFPGTSRIYGRLSSITGFVHGLQ
jgi:hypothetical protein